MYGHKIRIESLFLVLVISSLFLLHSWAQTATVTLIISSYVLSSIYLHFNGPISNLNLWPLAPYFYFAAILVITITILKKYIQLNNKNNSLIKIKNIELEKKNDELERFAYMAAHDLKTPLRNISIYLGLAKKNPSSIDSQNEYLNLARDNCNDLHQYVNDILEYSRLGHLNKKRVAVDINEIVNTIKKHFHIQLKEGLVKIDSDNLPEILGDPLLIKVLFQNLIENGLKYNKSKIPTVNISSTRKKDAVEIKIEDNGIGIEEKYLDQVFEVFQRLHSNKEYKGTGLGLAISNKIMEDYGGSINLDSSLNMGTTITLAFPVN